MTRKIALTLVLLASFLPSCDAAMAAEWAITLRQGKEWVNSSDLHVQSGATDVDFADVPWRDESYSSPLYFGIGVTRWNTHSPAWGFGLDYTGAKAVLDASESAFARGTIEGKPVDGPQRIGDAISLLAFSSLNLVTANAYHRWRFEPATQSSYPRPGTALFLGLGAGVAIPHVEAQVRGIHTDDYQFGGPTLRGVAGIEMPFDEHMGLIAEGMLSWVDLDVDFVDGGGASATLLIPQLTLGLVLRK